MPDGGNSPRIDSLDSGDGRRNLPDSKCQHLIDCLIDIGIARPAALEPHKDGDKSYLVRSLSALTLEEIRAWCKLTEVTLTPWESETLRLMSSSYSAEITRSRDKDALPPHDPRSIDEIRNHTSSKFQRLFKQIGG